MNVLRWEPSCDDGESFRHARPGPSGRAPNAAAGDAESAALLRVHRPERAFEKPRPVRIPVVQR